jgi:hypothetical protein
MTEVQAAHHPYKRWTRLARGLLLVGALPVVAFIFLPTILVGLSGGFSPSLVLSKTSPDERANLIVTKRVIIPANEMVDPSVLVEVQLQDTSGRVLDSASLELLEDSDLQEPHVEWTPEAAHVTGIDRRNERVLTLLRGQ